MVSQLHVHVIARREGDAGWPRPVWGAAAPMPYDKSALEQFMESLRKNIWVIER